MFHVKTNMNLVLLKGCFSMLYYFHLLYHYSMLSTVEQKHRICAAKVQPW